MKENNNDSEINIIDTSSKDEIIKKINPQEIIPVSTENNKDQATIETINKNDSDNQPKVPGRIGTRGTIELSQDCYLGADAAPADLLKDIVNINPETILSPLLTIRKSCFKRMTAENILKYQKREISDPLLRMETEDDAEASIQLFRNILSYMGDRKSSKTPVLHAKKIVKLVLIGNQILRDEAYLQIYKQLHSNSKYTSLMRGWKLMAIMASCFVPKNNDIYNFILNFLFFAMQNEKDLQIVNHIKYIFVRMIRIKGKERHHIPSEEELSSIEKLVPIDLPVKFFTGTQTTIKVESYTTVRELKMELMNKLDFNIQRAIYYSIYEICEKKSGTEERFIDDSEKVCDILSVWNNEIEALKKKGETCKFHLYLKLLIYYPFSREDIDTLSVVYYQTAYDVISGKHPVDENKIIQLAAYQLVVEFDDDEDKTKKKLRENLHKYIPANKFNLMTEQEWKEKVFEQYKKVNDKNKNDCKWEYLQLLKDLTTYQMQQFNARFNEQKSGTNEDDIPSDCIIGLCPDGIKILDREHNEVVFYRYETIMNWGISKNQLIISISTSMNEIKRAGFFTSQTKVIQTLIEIHCNLLIGKTLRDVQDIVKNYDTKFESIDSSRRIHSLMYKDEGGNVYDIEESKDNKKKKIIEIENKIKESDDNINNDNENIIVEDNTNNIPQQVIVPNED
jgi:hypothetical protein